MNTGSVSVRYARALLAFAIKQNAENDVYNEVNMLLTHLKTVPELNNVLNSPIISTEKKEEVIRTASGIHLSDTFSRFIRLVLVQKRETLFSIICLLYIDLYRKEKKIVHVTLTLAKPADSDIQDRITRMVEDKVADKVEFVLEIKPELIGGFILDSNGYQLDASVAPQLNSIKNEWIDDNNLVEINEIK